MKQFGLKHQYKKDHLHYTKIYFSHLHKSQKQFLSLRSPSTISLKSLSMFKSMHKIDSSNFLSLPLLYLLPPTIRLLAIKWTQLEKKERSLHRIMERDTGSYYAERHKHPLAAILNSNLISHSCSSCSGSPFPPPLISGILPRCLLIPVMVKMRQISFNCQKDNTENTYS